MGGGEGEKWEGIGGRWGRRKVGEVPRGTNKGKTI